VIRFGMTTEAIAELTGLAKADQLPHAKI